MQDILHGKNIGDTVTLTYVRNGKSDTVDVVLGLVAMFVALFARRGLWGLIDDHLNIRLFPVGYWLWTPENSSRPRPSRRGSGRRGIRAHRPLPAEWLELPETEQDRPASGRGRTPTAVSRL